MVWYLLQNKTGQFPDLQIEIYLNLSESILLILYIPGALS